MVKWEKTSKTVDAEGTTIVYECKESTITIESRKRHIPHANGRSGTWDHTSYVVIKDGNETKKYSLKDAKELAEEMIANEH